MYSPSDSFFTLFPKVSCFAAVLFLVGSPPLHAAFNSWHSRLTPDNLRGHVILMKNQKNSLKAASLFCVAMSSFVSGSMCWGAPFMVGFHRGAQVCYGCIQDFLAQLLPEQTRVRSIISQKKCFSREQGKPWDKTQHAKEDSSRYLLGHSKNKYMSVHLKWGLSTRWVRLAKSLFTSCSGGQDCLFVVHLWTGAAVWPIPRLKFDNLKTQYLQMWWMELAFRSQCNRRKLFSYLEMI